MNRELARRTKLDVSFVGIDISQSIWPYLLSLIFIDSESGEADDLQIKLQDRNKIWLGSWLNEVVQAASAAKLKINAAITQEHWTPEAQPLTLKTGDFEVDSIDCGGPPSEITIKATSLFFSSGIRQTKKSKVWEKIKLSKIAAEIASKNGMKLLLETDSDPFYKRAEQSKQSDSAFLTKLCQDAGISLKFTDNTIVLFDQKKYEAMPSVLTLSPGDKQYIKYKLHSGAASTQYSSCRVSYTSPTGKLIEGIAKAADYGDSDDENTGQRLEITAKVSSAAEAKALAEKHLRLHNKYTRTASFTLVGNPALVAGLTVSLSGWGGWDGKYIIEQAKHTVSASGYTTQITLRRCLGGY